MGLMFDLTNYFFAKSIMLSKSLDSLDKISTFFGCRVQCKGEYSNIV